MLNPFSEINWHPGTAELRRFGVTMAVGSPLVATFLALLNICSVGTALLIAVTGLLCCLACRVFPTLGRVLYLVWFAFGGTFGFVISNLLLGLFYFLIFTPAGWLSRVVFRRDPLCLKPTSEQQSNWRDCEKISDLKRYYKQY